MSCATRFHDRIADQALTLGDEAATGWLVSHGLLGLVDHPRLPSAVRDGLRQECRRNLGANLLRIREFQTLHAAAGGLPLCPLKGIFLLDRIYPEDAGRRYLRDIDLLVPPALEGRLTDRLSHRLGTTAEGRPGPRLTHDRRLTGTSGALIDIHTRLAFKHGAASTWEDLQPQPGTVHGCEVRVLDSETTLVHLVTHLVRHGPLTRLGWVEDIVRWIDRGLDSRRADSIAGRIGARRSFVAGIHVLRRITGIELLPEVVSPGESPDAGAALCERLLWRPTDEPQPPRSADRLERNLSPLLLADRPGDALSFLQVKAREVWRRNLRRFR